MGINEYKGCERKFKSRLYNDLKEMLINSSKENKDKPAFKFKTDVPGEYRIITYKEYLDDINALGTALINIGLENKRIAVISENRYEWGVTYFATVNGTGIIVPLDRSLPEKEIINLVNISGIEGIVYSEKYSDIMEKIRQDKIGKVKYFISMDSDKDNNNIFSFSNLIKMGNELISDGTRTFIDKKIDNEAINIILFTSGTTANSKAVGLSHKNICTNIYDISSIFDVTSNDTLLSFLPLHHTFECTVGFLYPISVGASIAYCEGIRHILDNIKEYKISAMISVPILFENIYKNIMKTIEKQGLKVKVDKGLKISNALRKVGIDKRRKIFNQIHENLGGNLRIFVAGAAAFNPEIEKGLNDIGIETYQGYGLTETSPVVAAEHKSVIKSGSVGKILPSMIGAIFEPDASGVGEIIVKGDSITSGYLDNKKATDESIIDGWFHTGDLGYFDKNGYLFITGRKKDVIVLKNGKNIYPTEIEELINNIIGVKESFVFGKPDDDDKNDLKLVAKIVYDKKIMKSAFNISDENDIKDKIWKDIKEMNKVLPTYKYIKEIIITEEELIKTTTMKIKRFEEMKKMGI